TWLAATASAYGVDSGDLDKLLSRVDAVPVSVALAQAALESGWGTSRLAKEGNALFGQLGDSSGPVIVAQGIGYRTFDSLLDGVRSSARPLTTNYAARRFRAARAALRHAAGEGHSLNGLKLLGGLTLYSERGRDYLADVRNLIHVNKLQQFDASRLVGTTPLDARADSARDPNDA
ncbi:MAG: glucosaminidase domain-containing protein, partial [Acetobacteraceae bacterium]